MEHRYFSKATLRRFSNLAFCLTFCYSTGFSQTFDRGEWLNISHTQKLSEKFDILAEHQLRSLNRFEYLTTFLLRAGLNYNFNKHHSVAVGYYYNDEWEKEKGEKKHHLDQRIFEQYAYDLKVERISTKWRARLEQRFVSDPDEPFSQKLSLQAAMQVPLLADAEFSKGAFAKIEDEIFFNIEHKDLPEVSFYDQNRPYFALGYRWSKKLETEFGYVRWYEHKTTGDSRTNVMQLKFTTNL
jgi:hypothetical protein